MNAVVQLIVTVIELYIFVVFAHVIMSWLVAFNVINRHNRVVFIIGDLLLRLTEPTLGPIRRILPNFGGIDVSPVVLLLLLWFVKNLIVVDLAPAFQ